MYIFNDHGHDNQIIIWYQLSSILIKFIWGQSTHWIFTFLIKKGLRNQICSFFQFTAPLIRTRMPLSAVISLSNMPQVRTFDTKKRSENEKEEYFWVLENKCGFVWSSMRGGCWLNYCLNNQILMVGMLHM